MKLSARQTRCDNLMFACASCQAEVNSPAATGKQCIGFNLFSHISFFWGNSCSITRSSPLASILRNSSHQLSSLTFQTAAPSFLLNAFCPFSKAPPLTKTWVFSPCQSCAPGWPVCHAASPDMYIKRQFMYIKRQFMEKQMAVDQQAGRQLCCNLCCNFCCND